MVALLLVPLLVAEVSGGAIDIGEKGGGMEGCWLAAVVPVADDDTAEMGGGGGGIADGWWAA